MYISRRNFLKAGAATLSIPFLESAAHAQATSGEPPKRVIYYVFHQGVYDDIFFPKVTNWMTSPEGVRYMPLNQISGNISQFFTADRFDRFRSKMNLLRGLDGMTKSGNPFTYGHQTTFALTASGTGADGYMPIVNESIDSIISNAAAFYPTAPFRRAFRGIPISSEGGYQWMWSYRNRQPIYPLEGPSSMFKDFFNTSTTTTKAGTPAVDANYSRRTALNSLLSQIQSLTNSPKLSAADRVKMQEHGDLMSGLINSIAAPTGGGGGVQPGMCTKPAAPASVSISKQLNMGCEARTQACMDMLYSALNCRLTNLAVFTPYNAADVGSDTHGSAIGPVDYHQTIGHDRYVDKYMSHQGFLYTQLLRLLNLMDATVEENGKTMLDNSLVVVLTELGFGSTHSVMDLPIVTFGSLGGKIKTGNYINYQRTGTPTVQSYPDHGENYLYKANYGRPVNSFHVSVLNALGIPPSQYERNGEAGFGDYTDTKNMYAEFVSADARRASLPLLVA